MNRRSLFRGILGGVAAAAAAPLVAMAREPKLIVGEAIQASKLFASDAVIGRLNVVPPIPAAEYTEFDSNGQTPLVEWQSGGEVTILQGGDMRSPVCRSTRFNLG